MTTMRPKATPYNFQMDALFGENSSVAELLLWFTSVSAGIILCTLSYQMMKYSSPLLFESYRKLPKVKKVEWDNRGFSTIHAIVATVTASYLLFISDIFKETAPYGPIPWRSTIFSQFNLGFSAGYFASDIAMIAWCYPILGGAEIILHHLVSLSSLVLALYCGHCHLYLTLVLFSECTTPFINGRWYLLTSGMKESKAYLFNGLALMFLWLGARVLLFVYLFWHLLLHYNEVAQIIPIGFYLLFIAPGTLGILNFFWFFKIVAGAMKTLRKRRD